MSLETGTLKVSGEGPEEYKHCREASMAIWQAGTTQAPPHWNWSSGNTYQSDTYLLSQVTLREGRVGLMNP